MATTGETAVWSDALNGVDAEDVQLAFTKLRRIKEIFAARGWFPATSGNLSLLVTPASTADRPAWERPGSLQGEQRVIAVTASGKDKSEHTPEDFLLVDADGKPLTKTRLKPSAETLVHTALYRKFSECRAVFHVHTVANNLISELYAREGKVTFTGHELIKAFNIWEEGASISVPIVENYADISKLAAEIGNVAERRVPGVLIRNHGIYVWGDSDFAAKRHLEAFEFLFEYQVKLLSLKTTFFGA
ncbi:methylthioribulose 1-phosphate dehydratase [Bacillaceae bacterium]